MNTNNDDMQFHNTLKDEVNPFTKTRSFLKDDLLYLVLGALLMLTVLVTNQTIGDAIFSTVFNVGDLTEQEVDEAMKANDAELKAIKAYAVADAEEQASAFDFLQKELEQENLTLVEDEVHPEFSKEAYFFTAIDPQGVEVQGMTLNREKDLLVHVQSAEGYKLLGVQEDLFVLGNIYTYVENSKK